jgi:nucleotide-binding universal stress UspA family protein
MAEVAAEELDPLRALFAPVGSLRTEFLEGDLVREIAALAADMEPDLIVAGVTRGRRARSVHANTVAVLEQTLIPAFLAFGTNADHA